MPFVGAPQPAGGERGRRPCRRWAAATGRRSWAAAAYTPPGGSFGTFAGSPDTKRIVGFDATVDPHHRGRVARRCRVRRLQQHRLGHGGDLRRRRVGQRGHDRQRGDDRRCRDDRRRRHDRWRGDDGQRGDDRRRGYDGRGGDDRHRRDGRRRRPWRNRRPSWDRRAGWDRRPGRQRRDGRASRRGRPRRQRWRRGGSGGTGGALSPAPGQYARRAMLLASNSEFAVGEVNGRIYVVGGYPTSPSATVATVLVYTIATDTWAHGAKPSDPRAPPGGDRRGRQALQPGRPDIGRRHQPCVRAGPRGGRDGHLARADDDADRARRRRGGRGGQHDLRRRRPSAAR